MIESFNDFISIATIVVIILMIVYYLIRAFFKQQERKHVEREIEYYKDIY